MEEDWIGREVAIGDEVRIEILQTCGRCVMVTHPQDELPKDKDVLSTVARRNDNNLGVLGRVKQPGTVSVGDDVRVGLAGNFVKRFLRRTIGREDLEIGLGIGCPIECADLVERPSSG